MRQIGAFEAKNRLSELLTLVQNGEEIMITKHGKPVARLVPPEEIHRAHVQQAVDTIKRMRRPQQPLSTDEILESIQAGRK